MQGKRQIYLNRFALSLSFEVQMPINRKTDGLTNAILALDPKGEVGVEWGEKKIKG